MALVVFSRTQHHPPAAIEASSKYNSLLYVLRERIMLLSTSSWTTQDIDACLLTVFLMSRYEGVIYRPSMRDRQHNLSAQPLWSHHNGTTALLKFWYNHRSRTAATSLIRATRRGIIRSSLLRNLRVPDWITDGSVFGEQQDLELDYDRIFVRAVNLHYAISAKLEKRKSNNCPQYLTDEIAENLGDEAQALEQALLSWVFKFPNEWTYRLHFLDKDFESDFKPNTRFYGRTVFSYTSRGYAAVWNQYFALGMLINRLHSRILGLIPPQHMTDETIERRKICIHKMQLMADNLASSIPFCLERFRLDADDGNPSMNSEWGIMCNKDGWIKPYLANLVVWPLGIASMVEGIDGEQQQWFRSQLAETGKATGEGVLESVRVDSWGSI
ncbi:MAG: hypothetical protein Q9168_007973 [Polycauliona sp. 1 TL-2023]